MSADKVLVAPQQRRRLLLLAAAAAAVLLLFLTAAGDFSSNDATNKQGKASSSWRSSLSLWNSPNAWVYMASDERTLLHVLVSAKSARLAGSTADVVLFWFGNESISPCMIKALDTVSAKIRTRDPPIRREDVTNEVFVGIIDKLNKWWDWNKLLTFDLIEYKKAVFLDGDTLHLENLDVLFERPSGTHTDAPKSPFNSGMFVVEPNHDDYEALVDLVKRGAYDLKRSWGGAFEDTEKRYRPRTYAPFYGAESTQGLLYYWFHTVKKQYKILPRERWHYQGDDDPSGGLMRPWFVHFNICQKPAPGVEVTKCRLLHRKWQEVYQELNLQCDN